MILDTNALSAWLDGDPSLEHQLETAQRISLSPIALGEFRFGILGSRHRASYEGRLRLIEQEFPPLPINAVTASHYAALRHELSSQGQPIPWHDLWIAARRRANIGSRFFLATSISMSCPNWRGSDGDLGRQINALSETT